MEEALGITNLLNRLFAGPVDALLQHGRGSPGKSSRRRSTILFALELLVVLGLIVFFVWVRVSLSVEKPPVQQHIAELLHEFIGGEAHTIIGHGYERFQAFVGCLFLFVLVCNLVGLIPGVPPPQAQLWCRLAWPFLFSSTTTSTE